jgi:hypothetical protein|tara:strand:+ start:411 stop:650 length:240 start_codon:yes stop_codon:yes gene_type:complete
LGAENLPPNVISFSSSLSVASVRAERERERERKAPSFRERKRAEEREATRRNDVRTIERKKKRLFDFTHFFKISLSFLS